MRIQCTRIELIVQSESYLFRNSFRVAIWHTLLGAPASSRPGVESGGEGWGWGKGNSATHCKSGYAPYFFSSAAIPRAPVTNVRPLTDVRGSGTADLFHLDCLMRFDIFHGRSICLSERPGIFRSVLICLCIQDRTEPRFRRKKSGNDRTESKGYIYISFHSGGFRPFSGGKGLPSNPNCLSANGWMENSWQLTNPIPL